MNIADVMDELAEAVKTVPSLQGRTYPYPAAGVSEPAAIIPFPSGSYDTAYGGGLDEFDMSVVVLIGRLESRTDRDRVVGYMAGGGAESITAAVDAYEFTSCDYAHVSEVTVDQYSMGGVDHWAVIFTVQVAGSGN